MFDLFDDDIFDLDGNGETDLSEKLFAYDLFFEDDENESDTADDCWDDD